MSPIKKKIALFLYKKSVKYLKEQHMYDYGHDVKCPNCNLWGYELNIKGLERSVEELEFGYSSICGNCKHKSYWNCIIAPVVILSNERGIPLKQGK